MTEPSEAAKAARKINNLAREEGDLLSDGHLERIIQRLFDEKDAEIEGLKKDNEALLQTMRENCWQDGDVDEYCVFCDGLNGIHKPDCLTNSDWRLKHQLVEATNQEV